MPLRMEDISPSYNIKTKGWTHWELNPAPLTDTYDAKRAR